MIRSSISLRAALVACGAGIPLVQDADRQALANLEWGGAASIEKTRALRERAEKLTGEDAVELRERLESDPDDLATRMTLLFYELPELRRKRRAGADPKPHGELVLGLIERHPRSRLAGTAGFLLYPYKRDGMYTGPAWEGAIELWERLVAEHPDDPAIAGNAGSFLMADPFLLARDGPRALALLERARELAPREPRWALKLGGYHSMQRAVAREPEARVAAARAALPHLRAAWDLTEPGERATLAVFGQPLPMVLASAYFDAGESEPARTFALLALGGENPSAPRGEVVFEMNAVLGRLALAAGDAEAAAAYLLAAGRRPAPPCSARSVPT